MYLFATVIKMEDMQYAATARMGLSSNFFVGLTAGDMVRDGVNVLPCFSPNSISSSSKNLFRSSVAMRTESLRVDGTRRSIGGLGEKVVKRARKFDRTQERRDSMSMLRPITGDMYGAMDDGIRMEGKTCWNR